MKNRTVFVIIGSVLVVLGLVGILLSQVDRKKQETLSRLELMQQQEEASLASAERRQKAEEEQREAQKIKEQNDLDWQRAAEEKHKLALEQARRKAESGRDEEVRRKEEERNKKAGAKKRKVETASVKREERSAREQGYETERRKSPKAVTIKLTVDPLRQNKVQVAHVHAGDQVTIKVRRMEGVAQDLKIGLLPLGDQPGPFDRLGRLPDRVGPLVATRVSDYDRFTIAPKLRVRRGPMLDIESRDGAILYVGTAFARPAPMFRHEAFGPRAGYYRVEITILSDNRWNIMPRSLL